MSNRQFATSEPLGLSATEPVNFTRSSRVHGRHFAKGGCGLLHYFVTPDNKSPAG